MLPKRKVIFSRYLLKKDQEDFKSLQKAHTTRGKEE